MTAEKAGLVVPLVLWGPRPLQIQMVQISSIENGKIILTGTSDGSILTWLVDEALGWIQPHMILLSHDAPITCISSISNCASTSKFITCSENGQVCLWDCLDGRVVESVRTNFIHRRMRPYASRNDSQEIMLCTGDYADIVALHSHDLNILYTLGSRVEPDWMASMTLVQSLDGHDVLVGVSLSGIIKLWSLQDMDNKDSSTVLFEDESKLLATRNVRSVVCSEKNMRMMLVVCGNSWQILDPSNLNQLILSDCIIEPLEGVIVDIDKVAIGFADSTVVLFQLPRNKLCGRQVRERFGDNPANVAGIDQPFVFALLKGAASSPTRFLSNPVKFFFDFKTVPDSRAQRNVVYRIDEQGAISFWHIPKNLELLVSEFIRNRRPIVYEPTIRQSLADAWTRIVPKPPALVEVEEKRNITATIFVGTQGKLLVGLDDGSILMMNACHTMMSQILENYGSHDNISSRKLLKEGHCAPVNCFLYPFDHSIRYDPNLLLSGGDDFAVVVWNISIGELVYRFCCQGGPITRLLVPPSNSSSRLLNSVCSIAEDNSACIMSLKELKCLLLASRQQFPIVDVRWRPLDDYLLLRCEDDSIYIWQIETGNLDRIVTGLVTDEIMEACCEQTGFGLDNENGEEGVRASQAVQVLRALRHRNMAAIRKIAGQTDAKNGAFPLASDVGLASPVDIIQLRNFSDRAHIILFNVDALIAGLLSLDYEQSAAHARKSRFAQPQQNSDFMPNDPSHIGHTSDMSSTSQNGNLPHRELVLPSSSNGAVPVAPYSARSSQPTPANKAIIAQQHSLYSDIARLLLSLLHAWDLDETLDAMCTEHLKLFRPKLPLCFGTISKKGHISLYTPYSSGRIPSFDHSSFKYFARNIHWTESRALTTVHLLAVISLSNTLMTIRNRSCHLSDGKKLLRRISSAKSTDSSLSESESQQIRQSWSNVAALHCVLLPDLVKARDPYASPQIEQLARKWQDGCVEIRDAAQALLIRELNRLGTEGRRHLVEDWGNFLPLRLDPSISIFDSQFASQPAILQNPPAVQQPQNALSISVENNSLVPNSSNSSSQISPASNSEQSTKAQIPPPRPSQPPIPPRATKSPQLPVPTIVPVNDSESSSPGKSTILKQQQQQIDSDTDQCQTVSSVSSAREQTFPAQRKFHQLQCGGVHQVRRNQATAIIVLGVIGAEFASDIICYLDICRATAQSILDLLLAPESPLIPQYSQLRRAAIDLLGRGFTVWQPHLDMSKVVIGLLNLAADCEKCSSEFPVHFGAAEVDAFKTARHALSLIASARPQALITALNMEVVRYNAVVQHQTIQHPIASPLMKSRNEVLRLLDQLSEKQYNFVADLIVPVGEIMVHCLDLSLLKQRTLIEVFPPIARFYMVAYCPSSRRLAFGGKNGVIVIHELRASKAQTVQAHKVPITALAFSQDGKYLAAYAAQDAKISFWQTQQTFLGMGQSQIRCAKTLPAPGEFPVISPGGSYQNFRARLVWINSKSLTLMLPNGKENRFSI